MANLSPLQFVFFEVRAAGYYDRPYEYEIDRLGLLSVRSQGAVLLDKAASMTLDHLKPRQPHAVDSRVVLVFPASIHAGTVCHQPSATEL